jgi:hypothetical protein
MSVCFHKKTDSYFRSVNAVFIPGPVIVRPQTLFVFSLLKIADAKVAPGARNGKTVFFNAGQ